MKKDNIIKVVILIIIILLIIGVWYYKNIYVSNENTPNSEEYMDKELENQDFQLTNLDEFDLNKLKEYNLPIVLDFSAEWCLPCQEFKPILQRLNIELENKAIIKIIDVDAYPELTAHYPIMYYPTQVLINSDGTPYKVSDSSTDNFIMYSDDNGDHYVTVHVGAFSKEQLVSLLKEMGMSE